MLSEISDMAEERFIPVAWFPSLASLGQGGHLFVLDSDTSLQQYIEAQKVESITFPQVYYVPEELAALPLQVVERIVNDFVPLLARNPYPRHYALPEAILEIVAAECHLDEALADRLAATENGSVLNSLCNNRKLPLEKRRRIAENCPWDFVREHFTWQALHDEIQDRTTTPERLRDIFLAYQGEMDEGMRAWVVSRCDAPADVVEAALSDPKESVRRVVLLRDSKKFFRQGASDGPLPASLPAEVCTALQRFARKLRGVRPFSRLYVTGHCPSDSPLCLDVLVVGVRQRTARPHYGALERVTNEHGYTLAVQCLPHANAAEYRNATGPPVWDRSQGVFVRAPGGKPLLFWRVPEEDTIEGGGTADWR